MNTNEVSLKYDLQNVNIVIIDTFVRKKIKIFSLIQTRKGDAKPEMFVIPTKWLISDGTQVKVQYPRKNFNTLSRDHESEPEPNWIKQPCKLLGKRDHFDDADAMMSDFVEKMDSSDAAQMTRGTRMTPAKKIKSFQSKSFALETVCIN